MTWRGGSNWLKEGITDRTEGSEPTERDFSDLRVSVGVSAADAQVDALVHEPYELTEEDAMVERLS